MKFTQLPLHNLEGATLNFEQLQTRAILDKTPQSFPQLLTAATLTEVDGTATVTFGGGTTATQTVTHNIGRTPRVWLQFSGTPGVQLTLGVTGGTNTQFTISGLSSAAIAGSISVFWLARG